MTKLIDKAEIPNKEELQETLPVKLDDIAVEHRDFDLNKALTLRLVNKNSYKEIADMLNCPKSTVHYRLSKFDKLISDPHATHAYDGNRANLLTSVEMEVVLQILDGKTLQKSTANQLGYLLKIVNEARRLEKGESTANISHHQIVTNINELEKELKQLDDEQAG